MVVAERVEIGPHEKLPSNETFLDARDFFVSNEENETSFSKRIEKSLETILQEQDPSTGLFPAATKAHSVLPDHYDHSWIRDVSMVNIALLDPAVLRVFPPNSETGIAIRRAGVNSIKVMLSLFASDPWQSAFQQEISRVKDPYGREYTTLTKDAPPVHLKTDGEQCPWPTQNQPDSWGEFLIAAGLGLKQNLLTLNPKEQETTERIAKFLVNLNVSIHEQSSMWEWGQVHHPAPTSTTAIVAKGLKDIAPYMSSSLSEPIRTTVSRISVYTDSTYPTDYTTPNGHESKTDLATLVAHGLGAFEEASLFPYLKIADNELGDGQYPGKKRFMGDHYYRGDDNKEAIWPMGALLEAKIFLDRSINPFSNGNPHTREAYRQKGLSRLEQVTTLSDQYGYIPELLQQKNGGLVPNKNHLLWNEALMIQACGRAIAAERLDAKK